MSTNWKITTWSLRCVGPECDKSLDLSSFMILPRGNCFIVPITGTCASPCPNLGAQAWSRSRWLLVFMILFKHQTTSKITVILCVWLEGPAVRRDRSSGWACWGGRLLSMFLCLSRELSQKKAQSGNRDIGWHEASAFSCLQATPMLFLPHSALQMETGDVAHPCTSMCYSKDWEDP